MKRNILIGTSGWGYDEWVGPFYPKTIKKEHYLLYYSKIFHTNEINTTFYNIPSKYIVESWVNKTPNDFLFSAKIPKFVTHKCKLDLDECQEDLNRFLNVMEPLVSSGKLLAFLIQLPPSFTKDEHFPYLKEFIENWPDERQERGYHLVVEFRHKSWMNEEAFNYLRENGLTYCSVIEPLLPPRMDITTPEFFYMRFHGYGKKIWFDYCFKEEEIKEWSVQLEEVLRGVEKAGVYFNNHFSGYAAKNSLMMMKELNISPRTEPEKIKILDIKKEAGEFSEGQTSLDKFMGK